MDGDASEPLVGNEKEALGWISPELFAARQGRPPDFEAENRALINLLQTMAGPPGALQSRLAELVVSICGAGSAVVAIPQMDDIGRHATAWRAVAGVLENRDGVELAGRLHTHAAVLDTDGVKLFRPPPGLFWQALDPPIVEALVAPFVVRGRPAGSVWAISHDPNRQFDGEDARRLASLARCGSEAYQAIVAQAELRASEGRFKALVTCPGPIIFRTDLGGRMLEAPGWEEMTGQAPSAHLGWGWVDAIHPDDRKASAAVWIRSLKTGDPCYIDYRLLDSRGAWRWVTGYGAPVRNGAGDMIEWMGTIADIHELREAKAALLENESYHRFAAEAGRTGSWYMRMSTGETVLSPMAAELFGLAPEQVTWPEGAWEERVVPDDREALRNAARATVHGEGSFTVEFRIRLDDGSERWLYSRGGVVRGPEGAPLRLHGATVDLTERKNAQARRLAIVELADLLRDMENPADMADASAEIIGRTLGMCWCAFGALDRTTETVRLEQVWSRDGVEPPARHAPFGQYCEALDRGEPIVALSPEADDKVLVIYSPRAAHPGPRWVLALQSPASRPWPEEDLAFVREAAERTHGAIERRRAELHLREHARELEREVEARTAESSRLWRNSRDLLLIMDRSGVLRIANPAWTTILGWDPDQAVGCNFSDFTQAEDDADTGAPLARLLSGEAGSVETRHRHKDGGDRWISWVAAPEDDLIYATGRHITAEKEAAAALEQTQVRLRTFFETSYQYRALVNLDGTMIEANATALAAAGASRETVVGLSVWETPWFAGTPGIPEAVQAAVSKVAAGEVRREDILLKLPAAGWRWLDFTLRPLNDVRGDPVAIVLEAVDITERRETEMVLRQSQKLEAMGQLTGGVAHDFNNLLTPIIGGLDILQRRGLAGERERRLVAGALQSAERAKTLVQRLLAFARRQPLQTGPVDVAHLIAGIRNLVASTVGPQVEVFVEFEDDLPAAEADANQLEMAVLNLCVNARDAMPQGGALCISTDHQTIAPGHRTGLTPGAYVRLTVSDDGMGMDEATLARAIEPFFSTKGQGRGTGLGLSMAHGLASQLGGALEIASSPGLGTKVDLWLPISAETATRSRTPARQASGRPVAGVVLLVDDEALARSTTAIMLTDMGYRVVEAASGRDALAIIDSERPLDLLVTDYLMPGMTGAELAQAFQARRPGLPLLIVTGYAEAIPAEFPHLGKPFRFSELAESMAALNTRIQTAV